jgi:cell division protein FtsI (penicillin-binding protein 3)
VSGYSSGTRRRSRRNPPPNWLNKLPLHKFPKPQANLTQKRLFLVWLVLIMGCLLLGINLLRLQVFQVGDLARRAKQQQTTYLRPFVPRRPIVDRSGNVVAIDRPANVLYAHPRYFKIAKEEVAKQLGPILGKPVPELLAKFNQAESGIKLEEALNEDEAKRVDNLVIDGLELAPWQQRMYPQQNLLANVIGYVDNNQEAQAGVEYSFGHLLKQSPKAVRLNKTGEGTMLPEGIPNGFVNQDDLRLQLTIDSRLQRAITPILQRQVHNFGAKRGLVLVMDALDGSILSMVSDPTFDANKYYDVQDLATFKNWALTDLYEPGSTFKPIVVAMALESGSVKLADYVYDSGYLEFDV